MGKQPQGKSQRFVGNRSIIKSTVRLVHIVSLKLCNEGHFYTLCVCGQPCSTWEAELPFTTAVNLTNWTSWAYEETMPQVLGLFEDSSVYLDIWRNASWGRGEGIESKRSSVIPLFPSFPRLQPSNIMEAGEYTIKKWDQLFFAAGCDFPRCRSWKSWGPLM